MKHTKGKWEIFNGSEETIIYTDVNMGILNSIYGELCRVFGSKKKREANAKLIASAPKMLEALQLMLESFGHYDLELCEEEDMQNIEYAKAVIDKITK